MLIDTHCHIHEANYPLDADEVISRAHQNGVTQMICIGTSREDSKKVIEFARNHDGIFATVGTHPHYAKNDDLEIEDLIIEHRNDIVAIGEIGLDYFYDHSPRDDQKKLLEYQLELVIKYDLPVVFHVRDAYDDFWPIFDKYQAKAQKEGKIISGEVHSFTDSPENLQKALDRGLYIGLNGFSTFTKDPVQKDMFANIPLDRILIETDAPYLTPVPFRGKVNEPAFVKNVADFHCALRGLTMEEFAAITMANAKKLFLF